jgi:hypothetical protein
VRLSWNKGEEGGGGAEKGRLSYASTLFSHTRSIIGW